MKQPRHQGNSQNNITTPRWMKITILLVLLILTFSFVPTGLVQAAAIINEGSTPPSISSAQITVQPETSSPYQNPTNSFTEGTLNYYLITQDSTKSTLTSITYKGVSYPLTSVFVGSNLTAMKIGGKPIFTLDGPLSNSTVFFDDGIYTDTDFDNYVGISQTNISLVGLNKDSKGEPAAILRRAPVSSTNSTINNTMERYVIYRPNIYLENLIFDGQGYDMYPNNGKSRGENFFTFSITSDGFVMRDCILENIGASNTHITNKNLAMNFYKSAGPHNFENVTIRNVKTALGLGIISFNQSYGNYFKNLTIVSDNAYNSTSRSIKIENVDTSLFAENLNSAFFTGTISLPTDSYHNHIYIQSWKYNKIVVPTNYRYAQYSTSNIAPAILVYQDVMPAVTSGKSILDLQDFAWLVQDGAAVTVNQQMATLATTISNAGTRAPDANIKVSADSSGKIKTFTLPSFGATRKVSLVAVPYSTSLYSSTTLVPFAANGSITLPAATAGNFMLYNLDFDSLAKYTLEEAITGITPLSSTTDPNDSSITGYESYSDYAPSTSTTPKIVNGTANNFSNSVFTSLVNQIEITNTVSTITLGSSFTLTGSLASTSSNSFTGTGFSGTIKDTADDQTIYWYSSDPTIASVDRTTGLVTALKAGTVTFIAKAADSNNDGEVEKPYATFTLTVSGSSGGNGNGGGTSGGTSSTTGALAIAVTGLPIPATGFTPGVITQLPAMNQTTGYQKMSDMWLEIPGLHVQSNIEGIPQTSTGWDVTWLGKETGWLNGTAFPTHDGNSVLAGHVYDQNGLPGPFASINKLAYGDQIIIHAWDQAYTYEVREVKTISPDNSAYVFKHQDTPWLTLVTCQGYDEKSAQYTQRLVVRAVLIKIQ